VAEVREPDGARRRRTLRDRAAELGTDVRELAEVLVLIVAYGVALVWAAVWVGLALRVVFTVSGLR
jgi:hypothetical protein